MQVAARGEITLACVVDIQGVYRYYLLQASTLAPPAQPAAKPPGGNWDDTEPAYTPGSTSSLYTVERTDYCDGTWAYSQVSLSSAYEAAKQAYNKAAAAQAAAGQAQADIDNLQVGGTNLLQNSTGNLGDASGWGSNVAYDAEGYAGSPALVLSRSIGTTGSRIFAVNKIGLTDKLRGIYPDSVTFSGWYYVDSSIEFTGGSNTNIFIRVYNSSNTAYKDICKTDITADTEQDTWIRFAITSAIPYEESASIYAYAPALSGYGKIKVSRLKLELGTIATDWTPAPEDVAAATDQAQATAEQAKSAADAAQSDIDILANTVTQEIASLDIKADGIAAKVSQQTSDISSVQQQVTLVSQNASSVAIQVQNILENGVDKVTTETGYTFNQDGLKITKSGQEMENLLDNTGMYVTRSGETILQANNQGVTAVDVTVKNYLIIGTHARFEDYGTNRTACFYI